MNLTQLIPDVIVTCTGWLEDTRDKVKKQVKKIPIPNISTSEEVQKWDGFEHAVGTDAAKKVRNIDGELENTKKEYNEWGVKTGKDIEKRVEGLKDDWDERAEEERQKVKEKYPDEYDEYEKYKATEEDNDKNSAGNWGRSNWGRSQCPVGSALKTSARKKNKENETCTLCTMYSP